ncbi:cytochrome P450 [Streptomyces goshikiensis]|uniref:cytochrome P450 n=1 Tax=Streptomyces goshikiensis TaxID=1942 RepID=UPI003662D6FB
MKQASPIPTASGGLPLLGHIVPLLRAPLGFLARLPEDGDLVRVRFGPLSALVVCDPALLDHVLRDDRTFDKGGALYDRSREFFGNGLGTCPHGDHRRQRRLLQPAFHPNRLCAYVPAVTARITETIGSWQDGEVLDVVAVMQELTARITIDTMFSTTPSPDVLNQALGDLNTLLADVTVRTVTPPALDRLPTPRNRRYQQARTRLPRTLHHLVTERRAAGVDHGDLLSMMLTARDPDSGSAEQMLADDEIVDQIVSFFGAGTETAASTLAWALHLLGAHPEIEKRLQAEVDSVLAGRPATHADLPRLELTGRIITETLRLWSPAWFFTRMCTADTRLGQYAVPSGTTILYSQYLLHRQADLYPDPERFDPDRWAPDHPSPPRREAFIPFGGGARKCIANRFATSTTVLALATIAARWRLRPLPGTHVRPAVAAVIRPGGLRMRAVARSATGTGAGPRSVEGDGVELTARG